MRGNAAGADGNVSEAAAVAAPASDLSQTAEMATVATAASVSSSNLSEKSESELSLNGSNNGGFVMIPSGGNMTPSDVAAGLDLDGMDVEIPAVGNLQFEPPQIQPVASYFTATSAAAVELENIPAAFVNVPPTVIAASNAPIVAATVEATLIAPTAQHAQNLNALQVLINEKAQLNGELNKYRSDCREKDFELEELRTQFKQLQKRCDDMQQFCAGQEQNMQQLRNSNAELQHKMAQTRAESEDQVNHLAELQQQLGQQQARATAAEDRQKELGNELEMTQLRIRQLSDESSISKDNRVETLTQTQFMYEQQIKDLQVGMPYVTALNA